MTLMLLTVLKWGSLIGDKSLSVITTLMKSLLYTCT